MAKFLRRLAKRRDAASTGQPEHAEQLRPEEPKARPVDPYSMVVKDKIRVRRDDLSSEQGWREYQ